MTVPAWLNGLVEQASNPVRIRPWQRQLPPTGQPGHRQSAVLLLFAPTDGGTAGSDAAAESDVVAGSSTDAGSAGSSTGARGVGVAESPTAAGSLTEAGLRSAPRGDSAGARTALPGGYGTLDLSDVSILLTERAHTLRSHAGQVSFPGGRAEPQDPDLVSTALRETHEEVGVEPETVEIAGVLPALNLAVSAHDVSPVLGWWARPGRVWAREPAEVASVLQVPVADLVNPDNRFRVGSPSGWIGPAFDADGLLVWGFTAMVLADILQVAGWEVPWDTSDVRPFPPARGTQRA